MCSISLSGKLLCLTGRFSVFRASVVADPTFRSQVEHDIINHWLWGSFEMLSGDDKSTWYWLAANGKRMLYVPDAMVTTFEVITGSSLKRANANIRRWSGNSVRHSWRAMMLGPNKLGWFAWWSLLDQRLTMLTVLFGPTVALLGLGCGQYELVAGYMLWVMCSRVSHASIAWRQGRRFSAYYVPLQIISDWATALTKLWVVFHPAKQNWMNRGARSLNTTTGSAFYGLRTGFAHYLYGFSCATLIVAIGLFVGFFPVLREARLFMNSDPGAGQDLDASDRVNSALPTDNWRLPGEPVAALKSAPRLPVTAKPPSPRPWMAMKFLGKPADDKQPKQFEPASHE
jgi:glycosyltransferase Alg8